MLGAPFARWLSSVFVTVPRWGPASQLIAFVAGSTVFTTERSRSEWIG
jgi:hypothetical protein